MEQVPQSSVEAPDVILAATDPSAGNATGRLINGYSSFTEAFEPKFPILWQRAHFYRVTGIYNSIERAGLPAGDDGSFLRPAQLGETSRLVPLEKIWWVHEGSVRCQGLIKSVGQVKAIAET